MMLGDLGSLGLLLPVSMKDLGMLGLIGLLEMRGGLDGRICVDKYSDIITRQMSIRRTTCVVDSLIGQKEALTITFDSMSVDPLPLRLLAL